MNYLANAAAYAGTSALGLAMPYIRTRVGNQAARARARQAAINYYGNMAVNTVRRGGQAYGVYKEYANTK